MNKKRGKPLFLSEVIPIHVYVITVKGRDLNGR